MCLAAEREEEEGFVSSLLQDMPKNYQIWNFRRQMFMKRQSKASDELSASAQALIQDHKNYHSWAHRQIVRKEEASEENWSSELNFVHQMLEDDPFNNSAWNQRAFVIRHLTSDHRNADLEAAFALVKNVPHCASGWNYLLWILFQYSPTRIKEAISFCHEVLKDQPHCVPCLEFLSELYFALGLQIHDDKVKSQCFASCERIWGACMKWDPVRFSYWRSRQRRLAALEPTTSV